MHANKDPRILRFRDGFWFSRAILHREREELEALRSKLSPDSLGDVLHAFATVWQIVDAVHRVRELAEGMPGLNKGDAWVRRFLDNTAIAEEFRHYVQHLRGELSKPDVGRFPVWGSLSWVSASDPLRLFTAVTGVVSPGMQISSGVFDSHENRYVSRVALSVKGPVFNVDPIVEETTAFCDRIMSVIEQMQPGLPPLDRAAWFSSWFILSDRGR